MLQGIQYTVSMPKPNTHYFEVIIEIPEAKRLAKNGRLRLVMPVWTPGSYLVREFSRNLLDVKAVDPKTNSVLKCEKDSKNSWAIEVSNAESIDVYYKVYAFEYTVDTSYLDTRHGLINGASVFLYLEGCENLEHFLTLIPFSEWRVISTGLEKTKIPKQKGSTFTAPNYDILIDCPIEIGNHSVFSFEVSGVKHEVSLFGPAVADITTFVSDIKRIVENTWPVFGEIPYKQYLFLIDFGEGPTGGRLEHLNSTHCIMPRLRMIPIQDYRALLSLLSHEFFHTWNVKRLRPKGLGPFDYNNEVYTKSLWIAEGITSYYDDLILRRSGIYSVSEYFDALAINFNIIQSFPSSRFQSAEEASFDTWIKHYRPNENSPNVHSSYYVQGAVIGWMIDMEIRKSTSNERSLDLVMRNMYKETYARENRGYSDEEFESMCNKVAGRSLSHEIFDRRVHGREGIDIQHYLDYAGLRLAPKSENRKTRAYLGVKLRSESGHSIVASKIFDSPADVSGLAAGDEIIALDDLRMDLSLIAHYIANKNPGDTMKVLISRDGYIETISARLGTFPTFEHRILKDEAVSEEQKLFFKAWMLSDWSSPFEYVEYTPSPQKPKRFDYL